MITLRAQANTDYTSVFLENETREYCAVNSAGTALTATAPSGSIGGTTNWCTFKPAYGCQFDVNLDPSDEVTDSNGNRFWGCESRRRR
jgi:hypothetical protein